MCNIRPVDLQDAVRLNHVMNDGKVKPFFIIICDTFDYSHSPKYFDDWKSAHDFKYPKGEGQMQNILPGVFDKNGNQVDDPNKPHPWCEPSKEKVSNGGSWFPEAKDTKNTYLGKKGVDKDLRTIYDKEIEAFFAGTLENTHDKEKGHVWIVEHGMFQTLTVEPIHGKYGGGQYEIAVRFPIPAGYHKSYPTDRFAGYIAGPGHFSGRNTEGH